MTRPPGHATVKSPGSAVMNATTCLSGALAVAAAPSALAALTALTELTESSPSSWTTTGESSAVLAFPGSALGGSGRRVSEMLTAAVGE